MTGLAKKKRLTVVWLVASLDKAIASVNMRTLALIPALENDFRLILLPEKFAGLGALFRYDVLIINKVLSDRTIHLASKAAKRNKPVIYDICDNIFEFPRAGWQTNRRNFTALLPHVSLVTVSTPFLLSRLQDGVRPEGKAFDCHS